MRDLHPDFLQLIKTNDISPVRLVFLDMLPNPFYFWDGVGSLQYGGNVYLGMGYLGQTDSVKESGDPKATQISMEFNCLESVSDFSDLRNHTYQNRAATISYALMNPEGGNEVLAVDQDAFVGRMDKLRVTTSPSGMSKIKMTAVNEMAYLKKSWGRYQLDSDHQIDYPGDTSRRFIPAIQDLEVRI